MSLSGVELVKSSEGVWLVMGNHPRPATEVEVVLWEERLGVAAALDWAKAPTSDEHLDGLDRVLGDEPTGYALAGRVRALYSRERIAANRVRQALKDVHDELTNGPTANWDYIGQRFQEGLHG